jgi:hypothetical protein
MSGPETGERTRRSGVDPPTTRASPELGGPLRTTLVSFGVGVTGFVVGFVLLVIIFSGLTLTGLLGPEPTLLTLFLVQVIPLQGIAFPLVALAYLRWRGLPFSYLRVRLPSLRDLGVSVLGLFGAFAAVIGANVAITLLELTPAQRGDQEILTSPEVAVVAIPLMILIVGPGEELLFRGVIQTTLTEKFSVPAAIVLASLAFAPAHIVAYLGTGQSAAAVALSISVLFLPSLVFGAVYEYTDNLVVPALAHGLYNAILLAIVVFGPAAA